MIAISALQKRASTLGRALFASLPVHVRLAYVFSVLAGTDLSTLGRSLGVVFIKKKVQGLPDIPSGPYAGPALNFPVEQLEAQHKDPTRYLPSNYLSGFAESIREVLRRRYRNEDVVDRAISTWLFYFIVKRAWEHMSEGVPLSVARNLVFKGLERATLNQRRLDKEKAHGMQFLDEVGEGENSHGHGRVSPDIEDPASTKHFMENLPAYKVPEIRRRLEREVHPDAGLYLDLLMEGYRDKEIILGNPEKGEPSMLPHVREKPMSYQNWMQSKKPKIVQILSEYEEGS